MNTFQQSFSVLRGIALAGLGAATLWAAAPAQASIDPSKTSGIEAARIARGIPASRPHWSPTPVLVAPGCPGCSLRHEPEEPPRGQQASEPRALPAPILVAPCPHCIENRLQGMALPAPILVAPCGQCIKSPLQGLALPAPILVAPCGQCMKSPLQGLALPAPILVAPCAQCMKSPLQGLALPAPILVAPGCGTGCRPAAASTEFGVAPLTTLVAGGEPPVVVDSTPWWQRLFG